MGHCTISPAYDLNPTPTDVKPRVLSTAINEDDTTASLSPAMDVAAYFGLEDAGARHIAAQVAMATRNGGKRRPAKASPGRRSIRMAH
jgi:hypothetical protein